MKRYKNAGVAIVTSMVGCDLLLFDPPVIFKNADYYAFVDRPHNVKCWRQLDIFEFSSDTLFSSRRNAKIFKILPELFLPGYEYYIWIDSTHAVMCDPAKIVSDFLINSDIAVFRHSQRNCVYEEAEIVLKLGYDHPEILKNQMQHYHENKYPLNNGLYEMSAFLRRNTSSISRLNLMWWEQICRFSSRDQLSLPFVLNKCNIKPAIIPGRVNDPFAYKLNKPVTNEFFKQIRFSYHNRLRNSSS